MFLTFHVPIFDVSDVPQTDVPCSPCPYISCFLTSSMSYKLMSLSFNVPVLDVPDVPENDDPFNPCPYISCPLPNSMSLNLISLSLHVPVYDVPDVPQIHILSTHVPLKFEVPLIPFPVYDVPFNPCPYISCLITNSVSLNLMSLTFHVPVYDVPDVHQIDVLFNPCSYISCP